MWDANSAPSAAARAKPTPTFSASRHVAQKAIEAWELGATEVCIQGGLPHGLPPFYYRDILRAVKHAVPGMHIHAFSPMEIVYGVELTGMPLADYLSMLRDNGLDTLPGTAAEILDDEVRHVLSRNKLSTAQWKRSHPHRPPLRHPQHFDADVRAHRKRPTTGSASCCCSAKFSRKPAASPNSFRSASCTRTRCSSSRDWRAPARRSPNTSKIHALARVLLAGSINNIQVSWVKLNRKLSQLCLHAGANDYGGTLMEENISREAGATAGQYTSPEDFQSLILEIGRIPAERNTTYTRIKHQAAARAHFDRSKKRWSRSSHDELHIRPSHRRPRRHRSGRHGPRPALGARRRNRHHRLARCPPRTASRREIKQTSRAQARKFPAMENSAACAAADLLVLTVPFEGQAALLKQLKPAIRPGSILIDATVAPGRERGRTRHPHSRRLARLRGAADGGTCSQGRRVVAAFHNLRRNC